VVELAVPSPHDHCHEVGVGVEVSVTEMGFGMRRKFLFVVKDATGAPAQLDGVAVSFTYVAFRFPLISNVRVEKVYGVPPVNPPASRNVDEFVRLVVPPNPVNEYWVPLKSTSVGFVHVHVICSHVAVLFVKPVIDAGGVVSGGV